MSGRRISLALATVAAFLCLAAAPHAAAQASRQDADPGTELLRNTVRRHCLACHNDRTLTAGLSLQGVDAGRVAEHSPVLEKVLQKLRAGEMPPPGRPRLDAATAADVVTWLETALDREATANPNPGAPAIHRLNRAEYRNAVRDLLGLDLDHARDLPADDSGYGFDNIGDVLTVSPLHVEQYVAAARRVSRLAVGSLTPRPVVERYEPPDGTTDEAIEGLPPNERGGILFRHYFAFDADYTLTVRVRGRRTTGMPPPRLDVRVDGLRVRLVEPAHPQLRAAVAAAGRRARDRRGFPHRIRAERGRRRDERLRGRLRARGRPLRRGRPGRDRRPAPHSHVQARGG